MEDGGYYQSAYHPEEKPFFVRLVLATRIVSSDQQAEYVLLGFAVLAVIISLFLLFGGPSKRPSRALPPPGFTYYEVPTSK